MDVAKFYGVGKKTVEKLHDMGVYIGADLLEIPEMTFIDLFGRFGFDLYRKARGISNSPVKVNRIRKILIKTIGLLIFWVLLVMAIMSWVSQGRSPIEYVLIQLAEPLLSPIRRILPAMGGIDFSPMVLVLLLYVVNMGIAEVLQATGNMLLPGLWMAL